MTAAPKVSPFLWFESRAEEAANFYVSLFPDSKVVSVSAVVAGPAKGGGVVEFELSGQRITALDGGPMFKLSPAVSFVVSCDSQEEIDRYWDALSESGTQGWCGWLEDRFGLSWQVLPDELGELMAEAPERVMETMFTMQKIDVGRLREAGQGA